MALYHRAVTLAKNHDEQAALDAYSAVVDWPGVPADIQTMALYNRSVVYTARHDDARAILDLQRILATPGAAGDVRLEAKRKLYRMEQGTVRRDLDRSRSKP